MMYTRVKDIIMAARVWEEDAEPMTRIILDRNVSRKVHDSINHNIKQNIWDHIVREKYDVFL